jgi:ribosomal protein L37AE/L43A
MTEQEDELHRCDGCHSDRRCRLYRGLWLCLTGPQKCYRHRKNVHALKLTQQRRNEQR